MGLFDFFRKREAGVAAVVELDAVEVRHRRRDGTVEAIAWSALSEVGIVTTSDGPFGDDVFWMLLGADRRSGCAIPSGVAGCDQLLKKLQQLPGFDNEAVIRAMGSTTDVRFVCWIRPT